MPEHLTRRRYDVRRCRRVTERLLQPLASREHPPRPKSTSTRLLATDSTAASVAVRDSAVDAGVDSGRWRPPLTAGSPMSNSPIRNGSSGSLPAEFAVVSDSPCGASGVAAAACSQRWHRLCGGRRRGRLLGGRRCGRLPGRRRLLRRATLRPVARRATRRPVARRVARRGDGRGHPGFGGRRLS